eukprot:TRINITY_DN19594_c0_g1_i5.p2 TRINITY_DN19594_c0_g1~~TRINITY_DN19594_c0_g1_i5.p2  ORF type:complete len:175 (+),score=24.85 TRINITY_DN19594_c0_g1_i5:55-525(+)
MAGASLWIEIETASGERQTAAVSLEQASSMSGHDHHHGSDLGTRRLAWAVAINLLLTAAQVIGGVLSGSLSLVADALHNFSDAAGLLLALVARRISKRPADEQRTFGYGRAEVVGGLINLKSGRVQRRKQDSRRKRRNGQQKWSIQRKIRGEKRKK